MAVSFDAFSDVSRRAGNADYSEVIGSDSEVIQ